MLQFLEVRYLGLPGCGGGEVVRLTPTLQAKHTAARPAPVAKECPPLLDLAVLYSGDARGRGVAAGAGAHGDAVQWPVADVGGGGWAGRRGYVAEAVIEEVKLGRRWLLG